MIGRTVGSYRVVRKLGEGGMGSVYAAVDLMLEREVAIKVLRPELAGQHEIAERFRAEAVILARLHHPHIATLYNLAREGGELLMVMEMVDGDTLERILQRTGPIPVGTAVAWCRDVLGAMSYAHGKGVVHRDIKPANVMITGDGTVKVTDFGIARVLGAARMTRTGHVVGTAAYMAPEQVRGREADARCDIYALATVLFELLTGRTPFTAEDDFALMTAQVNTPPPSARTVAGAVPAWLDEAIARALAKAPEERFQTATAFREVLVEGLRTSALPDGAPALFSLPVADAAPAVPSGQPPPTRLATPEIPPTRLAARPIPPPRQPETPGLSSGPAMAASPARRILGMLNWRRCAGAAAVLVLAITSAFALLGRSFPAPPAGPASIASPQVAAARPEPLGQRPAAVSAPPPPAEPVVPPAERPLPARLRQPPAAPDEPVRLVGRHREPVTAAPKEPAVPEPAPQPPAVEARPPSRPEPEPEPPKPAPALTAPDSSYRNVQWNAAEGDESEQVDVVLEFRLANLTVRPSDTDIAPRTIAYASVVGLAYSQTRPSRLKRYLLLRRSGQHWLILRMNNGTAVLQLQSSNYRTIIEEVEKRTGLTATR